MAVKRIKNSKGEDISTKMFTMGGLIRLYRDITNLTQKELCVEISDYMYDLGFEQYKVLQTSIAKYELGSAIPDYNITRFLNDRILKTDIDVKVKALSIAKEIISITEVQFDEIKRLFDLRNKFVLLDFLEDHLRTGDNPVEHSIIKKQFLAIVDELSSFSRKVDIELHYNESDPQITCSTNSTGLLLLYLIYQYIYIQVDNKRLYDELRSLAADFSYTVDAKSRVHKSDFVKIIDEFIYGEKRIINQKDKDLLVRLGLLYQKGNKNTKDPSKTAIVSNLTNVARLHFYIYHEFGITFYQKLKEKGTVIQDEIEKSHQSPSNGINAFEEILKQLIKDPIMALAAFYSTYEMKEVLNSVDEIFDSIMSFLNDKGNELIYINKDAFKKAAQEIKDNNGLDTESKKIELLYLFENLQNASRWEYKTQ